MTPEGTGPSASPESLGRIHSFPLRSWDLELIDQAKVFHFGTLSLTDEPVRTAAKRAVEYARKKGKWITFDPNLRLPLWNTPDEAREQILWGLSQTDVVKISDEEVEFLWGITDEEKAAEKLQKEFGVKLSMVTMGPRGAYLSAKRRPPGGLPQGDAGGHPREPGIFSGEAPCPGF